MTPVKRFSDLFCVLARYYFLAALCGALVVATTPLWAQTDSNSGNLISGKVTLLDRGGNELQDRSNVVVFVDGNLAPIDLDVSAEPPMMSHKGRKFQPRVFPIQKGDAIDFLNDDNIYHNVFSLSKVKTFDLGIYPEGTSKLIQFDTPGLIKIYCNLHPDMVSNILVLQNRHFTVTDEAGKFVIEDLPNGAFTLRAWHEFAEEISKQIVLNGEGEIEQTFVLQETKRRRQHKNKFGQPYRTKY